jgi:hypothetical protein
LTENEINDQIKIIDNLYNNNEYFEQLIDNEFENSVGPGPRKVMSPNKRIAIINFLKSLFHFNKDYENKILRSEYEYMLCLSTYKIMKGTNGIDCKIENDAIKIAANGYVYKLDNSNMFLNPNNLLKYGNKYKKEQLNFGKRRIKRSKKLSKKKKK